jgi:hypothetical protein
MVTSAFADSLFQVKNLQNIHYDLPLYRGEAPSDLKQADGNALRQTQLLTNIEVFLCILFTLI